MVLALGMVVVLLNSAVVVLLVMVVLVVNKPEICLKNDHFNFDEKLTIICGDSDRAASHCPKSISIANHV